MASREDNGPTGGATHHDDPANAKTKRTLFKKKTRKVSTLINDKTASRKSRKTRWYPWGIQRLVSIHQSPATKSSTRSSTLWGVLGKLLPEVPKSSIRSPIRGGGGGCGGSLPRMPYSLNFDNICVTLAKGLHYI